MRRWGIRSETMKEIPETCPSCGAFRDADRDEYDCGTRMTGPGVEWRSPQCEYRENQNLRSEITKLKAERDSIIASYNVLAESHKAYQDITYDQASRIDQFKAENATLRAENERLRERCRDE
jgi:hypothetical protein